MSRNGGKEDYYSDDDYYGEEDSSGDDYYEAYDSTDDEDVCQSDADDPPAIETSDDDADAKDKCYDFETLDDVRRRQDDVTATISDLLSVPRGFAAALLRHCQWDAELLQNEWFSDEARIRGAVGLVAASSVPTLLNSRELTCAICFDTYGPGEMRSAGCSHYYCHGCWRGYIHSAVSDGSRCLLLRCPAADPPCPAPVVRELVDAVAGDEDRSRYATFVVRSFVEEGTSKYVRWCPGPGCTLAVRLRQGGPPYEVACPCCRHVYCFRCGEQDAHRPASCDTARAWAAKCGADGETSRWVLANTKHCPKCRRAIEKNQGCNHMTCGSPCLHEFCWLCLDAWEHHAGDYFHCNRYAADKEEFSDEKTRRRQARASKERFLHYYERWCAHGESEKKARQDMEGLRHGGGLDRFAAAVRRPVTEMDFLLEAYARIVEARRVLKWTYAHVYHMDPKRDKLEFCEYLQGEAEGSLERLHDCAEKEREKLREDLGEYGVAFPHGYGEQKFEDFKQKLSNLNRVTRNHFSRVVEGFESGMPELVL